MSNGEDVTTEELAARLGEPELTVLDVRSALEFTGEAGYPCDSRQGHIPGARNVDVQELLGLAPAEIRALVGLPDGAEVIAYCHVGSRSGIAAELLRGAGYRGRNYVGSWHEWSSDPALPAE